MTTQNEKVLTCHHCGNRTAMKEVAKYTHEDIDELWDTDFSIHSPYDVIVIHNKWRLLLCPVCINVTLEKECSNSKICEPNGDPIVKEELIYPFKTIESNYIPKNVSAAFEAALKVRQIDGAICAIAIRRTLEMMCKDKGADGNDLFKKLQFLSEKGTLPPILKDMASVLRVIGNAAAHADEEKFNHDLVPSMIEFTKIILDYVYNLPKQIENIQDRIGKKPFEVTKETTEDISVVK